MTDIRLAPEGAQRTRDSIIKELISICDDTIYDIGKLSYGTMRNEPCGRSLFDNYVKLSNLLAQYRTTLNH